jgi:hypothetical protein
MVHGMPSQEYHFPADYHYPHHPQQHPMGGGQHPMGGGYGGAPFIQVRDAMPE